MKQKIQVLGCLNPHWAAMVILDSFREAKIITKKQAKEVEKFLDNPKFPAMFYEDYLKWRKTNLKN